MPCVSISPGAREGSAARATPRVAATAPAERPRTSRRDAVHLTGVPVPKLARIYSTLSCERRTQRDTRKSMLLVPPLEPEARNPTRRNGMRASGSGALSRPGLGGALGVPPPHRGKGGEPVFRQRIRPAEAIPAGRTHLAVSPLGNDVEVPQQHAVERLGGGDQLVAVLGVDDAIDQRVDGLVPDPDQVARADDVGGLRSPVAALLVAGRQRLAP